MTVYCADCKRSLHNPPALVIGAYSFGPRCAKRYIVAPTRTLQPVPMRLPRARPVVDEAQPGLFDLSPDAGQMAPAQLTPQGMRID